ncbi:hypothetical protein FPQ18DRAFT_393051 [Pyronema domesticum]|nr:hypothetical protein FPQ18DRAFT_393051 [Pyronema domesticum]
MSPTHELLISPTRRSNDVENKNLSTVSGTLDTSSSIEDLSCFCILCGESVTEIEELILYPCQDGSFHQRCWVDHVNKYGSRCPYCHNRVKYAANSGTMDEASQDEGPEEDGSGIWKSDCDLGWGVVDIVF